MVFYALVKMEDVLSAVIWKDLNIYCSVSKARCRTVYSKLPFVLESEKKKKKQTMSVFSCVLAFASIWRDASETGRLNNGS